jgi:hypothetical protein
MSGSGCKMDVYHATSASSFAEASFACPQESDTGFNVIIALILDAIFLVSIFLMLLVLSVSGAAAVGLVLLLLATWAVNVNKALRKEENL